MRRFPIRTAGSVAVVIAALMSASALAGTVRSGSGEVVTSGSGAAVTNRGPVCDLLALQAGTCLDARVDGGIAVSDAVGPGGGGGGGGGDGGEGGGGDGGEGGGNDGGDGSEGGDGGDGGDGSDGGDGGDPNGR